MIDTHVTSSVQGDLGYLTPNGERPFNYMYEPPPGQPRDNVSYEWRRCTINDARPLTDDGLLESAGFCLRHEPTAVSDFYEDAEVIDTYYREVEALACHLIGGRDARVFDHTRRRREAGRPPLTFGRQGDGTRPAAVGRIHGDYTELSGPRQFAGMYPNADPNTPFAILNFWRPLLHPVVDTPLAMCDVRSFADTDWVASDIHYPHRSGEIYLATHSPAHRWYYMPRMTPDEVLVFKTYDSRRDGRARMTPHCAFDLPEVPADAPLRRSIEARCLVILS